MSRLFAAAIALVALFALVAQFVVSNTLMGSPGWVSVVWRMAGYFTVLTNALVAVTFAALVLHPKLFGCKWSGGLTLWICAVGIVYHAVLAGLWKPEGLAWWADQMLHTAVPMLVVVWWLRFADKTRLRFRDAFVWLIWPALYCAYALIRGALSEFYAYPFIDVTMLGAVRVAANVGGLVMAFGLGGMGLVAFSRQFGQAGQT